MAPDSERGGWAPVVVLLVLICCFVLLSLAVVIGFFYAASAESRSALADVERQRALAAKRQALAEATRLRVLEAESARNTAIALLQTSRSPLNLGDALQSQDLLSKLCALHQGTSSTKLAELLAPNFAAKTLDSAAQLPFGGDWLPRGAPTLVGVQPVGEKLRLHYIRWFGNQAEMDALVTIVRDSERRLVESIEFLEASNNPVAAAATLESGTTVEGVPRPALANPQPSDILVPPNQDAEPLSLRDLADANDVARRFLGCLVINDFSGMKAVATERMQAQNPFNALFDAFLYGGGFDQEPKLVATRLLGSQCILQYRVKPDMAPPFAVIMSLLKKAGELRVDYRNRHAASSPEIRPKVEPQSVLEVITK